MRVMVAGATGAIGTPLIRSLLKAGHTVVGLTRNGAGRAALEALGAEGIQADILNAAAVLGAVARAKPETIINQLTALPKHYTPDEMKAAAPRDREVRLLGNAHLLAAVQRHGVRRYLLQSAAFWYAPGEGAADERTPFAFAASPGVAAGTKTYAELEAALRNAPEVEGVVLRYGFFYGPGTWFSREGDMGEQARRQAVPVIGNGTGVWNFVHIEDAAAATMAALRAAPGAYNIVNDEPKAQREWLPAFARYAGGRPPDTIPEEEALRTAGADAVYYAMKLRAASNGKAKRELKWRPRPFDWL